VRTILFLLFIFFTAISKSQIIKGTILDNSGNKISQANVFFKKEKQAKNFQEFTIAKNGYFEHVLKREYDSLYITIQTLGYEKKTLFLKSLKSKTINLKFELLKRTTLLDEVVVISKKRPFTIKKDTIRYNVKGYMDGSERKIEEVIKKLPGIQVNEQTGEIKYKGKSVETVTLDGDNLFGFNYTLGTKNINVDIVEQIEAIDNYSENHLLKGIEQGGKVSLNLKLKKGKTDLSGNFDVGLGIQSENKGVLNINSNILLINRIIKSFSTISRNNIGINHSPFDYFSFNLNTEQLLESNYTAKKIIPETQFSNLLDDKRVNINNQFFGNYNAIFKLKSKLSIKTNLYYLKDRISTNQLFENQFEINNQNFITSDNTSIIKRPQQYRGDVEVKYNTSKTSLLEYKLRLRQENIETPTTVIQNKTDTFSTFLNTEDFYLKQDLLWTKKLSDKKALQVSLFHSFNDLPQTFSITPSLFGSNALNDTQESNFRRTFLEGKATYLGSGKRDRYIFSVGANLNSSPFTSRLFNSMQTISENNFSYTKTNIFNRGMYNFNRGNWQILPSYSIRVLSQKLKQNIENLEEATSDFIFEPTLNLKYKLNSISFLSFNLGYNQNTSSEQYFFSNKVLINNRTTINNLPSLELQSSQGYSLLYFNNDLYNQFQFNANVSYLKSTGNIFTNQNITEDTTQIEYFFLPQDNSNWNMNIQISKYIPFIESTLKLTSNYSNSNFRNVVNNSDLRQNQNQFLSNSFFWKTAFDIFINFKNTFTYQYSNSKSENQASFTNKSWQNTFKAILKTNERWSFIVSSDYYIPNTKQSEEQFFFLDATLRHKPKSKKWEISFITRNLTNEKNFEQFQTSDISTSIFRSNLLPMYFLVNLTWNF